MRITSLVLAAIAVACVAVALWPSARKEERVAAPQAGGAAARFGPGLWSGAPVVPDPEPAAVADTVAPPGPHLDRNGNLQIDKGLRDLFDHFLLGGHPGSRTDHVAALRAHLQDRLPSSAFAQCWQLAERYLAYLDEHDRLLAHEPKPVIHMNAAATPLDVDRVRAWIAQRARLRQTLLGMQVAQIWFGEEERELEQMLLAAGGGQPLRPEPAGEPDVLDQAGSVLRELEAQAAPIEVRRAEIAARFGEEAARRYDALEREEQAWQSRFETYRQQAQAIRSLQGVSEEARAREIEDLRARIFTDEAQRLRATALDS